MKHKKNIGRIIALLMALCVFMCACSKKEEPAAPETPANEQTTEAPEQIPGTDKEDDKTAPADTGEEKKEEEKQPEAPKYDYTGGKQVIVYFANWYLGSKTAKEGAEVAGIPWDSVTYINHAFWEVAPADGSTESSFDRRDDGEEPRTAFAVMPTDEQADLLDEEPSEVVDGLKRNHFAEYEYFSELYPDVNIMISVGGWTDSGYFSEMAYTEEGRKSFTDSCVALLEKYPWIDGIDLDWEYPAGNIDGERWPEDDSDEGCPIWGTPDEDNANFAALVKLMKESFAEKFGEGAKKITACASASTGYTLCCQDWAQAEPYLDYINIMTYDMAGTWDGATGFMTSLDWCMTAARYLKAEGIPASKLNLGSPMYSLCELMKEMKTSGIVGAEIEEEAPNEEEIPEDVVRQWEAEAVSGYEIVQDAQGRYIAGDEFDKGGTGWHMKYHPVQGCVYMYNDDEASPYYKWYVSYENPVSLQLKLDLIYEWDLAGIIVWEVSEDTTDKDLIKQMGTFLK